MRIDHFSRSLFPWVDASELCQRISGICTVLKSIYLLGTVLQNHISLIWSGKYPAPAQIQPIVFILSYAGQQDWSDYALWWPERMMWLTRPRLTLQSEGVNSDSKLQFTRQNKPLRIQLPDRTVVSMKVNMAIPCFHAVEQVCKTIGIRRFEELSFMRCANRPVENNPALTYFGSRKNQYVNALLDPLMVRDRPTADQTDAHIAENGEYLIGGQSIGTIVNGSDVPDGLFMDRWSPNSLDKAYLHGLWVYTGFHMSSRTNLTRILSVRYREWYTIIAIIFDY